MSSKKRLLFTLLSIILTSCHESWTGTPVTYCMPEGGVVFSVVESGSNQIVGTMQFLPLKEKEISIRFEFDKVSDISFVFTYRSDLFEVARQQTEGESVSANESLFGHYPYVETKNSLHNKLSKIVFEGETRSVTEGKSETQRIAINGSGKLVFEYDSVAFNPSKHFYTCEGLSFMPEGFSLYNEGGKKAGEDCDVWYYISDGDVFHYRTGLEESGL